jgi:hypothetical protein
MSCIDSTATTDLQAANCIDYGKQCSRKGYFISRKAAVLITVVYICSLVVTGLLVFYCVPRSNSSKLQSSDTNLARSFRMKPQVTLPHQKTHSSNRLPTHTIPTHYRSETIFLCFWIVIGGKLLLHWYCWFDFNNLQYDQWIQTITKNIFGLILREIKIFCYRFPSLY